MIRVPLEQLLQGADGLVVETMRLSGLLHDVGKPQTRGYQKGKGVTFHHHDAVGARKRP